MLKLCAPETNQQMQSKFIPNPKITLNCTMCVLFSHDKHGFRESSILGKTEKMFSGFVVSICIYIWTKIDCNLGD